MFIIKQISQTNSMKILKKLIFQQNECCQIAEEKSPRKRDILELSNELRDARVKQKQAAVLQRFDFNLSRSSLYKLEINRDQIVQQPSGNRQKIRGGFKAILKFYFHSNNMIEFSSWICINGMN